MNKEDLLFELNHLRISKNGEDIALHKPLLLLLIFSKIIKGKRDNCFFFNDLEKELVDLLRLYGWKDTKTYKPQYPFVFLSSSKIWNCSVKREDLKYKDAPSKNEIHGAYGEIRPSFFSILIEKEGFIQECISTLLNRYWARTLHAEILQLLKLDFELNEVNTFPDEVLEAYQYKCAICGQSFRFRNKIPLGIDICQIRPLNAGGKKHMSNSIALCKQHNWAIERGIMTINSDYTIEVSSDVSGEMAEDLLFRYNGQKAFVPKNENLQLCKDNVFWHRKYIFVG